MNLFSALGISESGADAMQTWIDTSAGNVANINDTTSVGSRVYAQQTPVFAPVGENAPGPGLPAGEGVGVAAVQLGTDTGLVAYEPTSPLANAQGEVAVPNVTLANQMVGMITAEENYSANTVMMSRAQQAYTAALTLGS